MARSIKEAAVGAVRISPDAPLMRLIRRGALARAECSHIDCAETLTARCAYTDRHGARCPTHWCVRHAQGSRSKPYCPVHIVSMASPLFPEHKIAAAVEWVGRAVDDDIVALLRPVSERVGENLMSEPVRFGTVGLDRVRIWERTWKTYSDHGVGCRVSVGIEDRSPDLLQIRVNSTTVTNIPTPWDPVALRNPRDVADKFGPLVVAPVTVAVDVWLQNAIVHLQGLPAPLPRH